jgi:diphthamide synthase (EF-2-diphthine--ammonia ligase)
MVRKRTLLSWSSGKDSAWALCALRRDPTVEAVGLFSVLNERFNRVSMHSTRTELLRRQAEAAGLALDTIRLPDPCSNEQCDAIIGEFHTIVVGGPMFGGRIRVDIGDVVQREGFAFADIIPAGEP